MKMFLAALICTTVGLIIGNNIGYSKAQSQMEPVFKEMQKSVSEAAQCKEREQIEADRRFEIAVEHADPKDDL